MTPPMFTVIAFQQPNTLMCPACGFTSANGPDITFQKDAQGSNSPAHQLTCTRCSYGSDLEWLMQISA